MRAIVYVRVSTDAQERDGTSLDTQQQACLDYARAAGWTVVDLVRDAASGFSLERPGIETIRAAMRSKACDVVLAYAVDRLSRHQNHIGVLFDEADGWGVQFEFVTERFEDTAMGRFILAARAFMAEVEREKIAERTMRGKAERARAGKLPQSTGKGLYGYTYNRESGQREVEPTQAAVVRRIYEHYAATRSFSAVANELNDAGVPAFSGGRWHPLTIRNVLTNESYTGRTVSPDAAREDAVGPNTEANDARRRTPRVRLDRGRRRHPADRPARPLAASGDDHQGPGTHQPAPGEQALPPQRAGPESCLQVRHDRPDPDVQGQTVSLLPLPTQL
ncbi:MAG: recombinase family protein [Dehalococcoidia bacterium]|nr:recombinase family protein [Dehalococcoidia bacterium]